MLPHTWSENHQIDIFGAFEEGLNVPWDSFTKHMIANNLQFLLIIPPEKAKDVELWLQLVLDLHELRDFSSMRVSMNIYAESKSQPMNINFMRQRSYRKGLFHQKISQMITMIKQNQIMIILS